MSSMSGRFIQIALAGAALVFALALTQVAAVESDRTARTLTIRLEQAEMLMQTGCMEAGTY